MQRFWNPKWKKAAKRPLSKAQLKSKNDAWITRRGAKVLESQVEKSMEKPLRNSRTEKYKRCLDHKPWITGAAPNAPLQNNNKEALLRSAGYEREAARLSGAWTRTEGPEDQLRQ